eukprot:11880109-Prorocentrum_lima.AAC.1
MAHQRRGGTGAQPAVLGHVKAALTDGHSPPPLPIFGVGAAGRAGASAGGGNGAAPQPAENLSYGNGA